MTIEYLVTDINTLLCKLEAGEEVEIPEELYEEFGKVCIESLKRQMQPRKVSVNGALRMSNIGRPDRILYYEVNHPELKSKIRPSDKVRFMYGDMVESLMIFLMEASGNAIEDKQGRCNITVGGQNVTGNSKRTTIKGSCDGSTRGTVFDIKSSSSYAYNTKFAKGGLEKDDPFGYLFQLGSYGASIIDSSTDTSTHNTTNVTTSTKTTKDVESADRNRSTTPNPGFFVVDKSTGQFKVCEPKIPKEYEVKERIEHVLLMVDEPHEPPRCHAPIPKGTKGNMILPKPCGWCDFKFHCHRDANDGDGLRTFEYKTYKGMEPTYFTEVVDLPRVQETTDDY